MRNRSGNIRELVRVVGRLRGRNGCAWDRKQNHKSVIQHLIEECYELIAAINQKNSEKIKEELGDVLIQIVLHAQMQKERGNFDIYDVAGQASKKLVRRHPHVFSKGFANRTDKILHQWEKIKLSEKRHRKSLLDGVPHAMPALVRARRLQERAARIGFDWKRAQDVFDKLEEELRELKAAVKHSSKTEIEEETGDLLFTIVNYCRKMNIDAENALQKASLKFDRRFRKVEEHLKKRGELFNKNSMEYLESVWKKSKSPHK